MVDMGLSLIETRRESGDRPNGTRGFSIDHLSHMD